MLPIAVLPIAGLLLRLGQPDLFDWPAVAAAGEAIFSNLGLLFAVGVGVGLARENHGAAGLAALVGYLVTTRAIETLLGAPAGSLSKLSIPVGLLSGIIAGIAYNRFANIKLPDYLSFFGGRRFVPIVSGLAGLGLALLLAVAWPALERGMDAASHAILGSGSLGLFAYGVLNRLLIVTGLHHILNNFAWFILGDYHGATGDLKRFFAGDPSAGAFMSGFFPVMMFGLPGACLAMYHTALPARRAAVGGLLMSLALTSFLTGVTEPVEFTFMFLAPLLYALHALATGLAMVIMDLCGVRLGFGFSAGFFDYVLNFSHARRPWLLLPIGVGYFILYYVGFRLLIVRLDLATPGRGAEETAGAAPPAQGVAANHFIVALGGVANLLDVAACTTRLRLRLSDPNAIDEAALKRLGARAVLKTGGEGLQVVLGPMADQIAGEIRAALRAVPPSGGPTPPENPRPPSSSRATASAATPLTVSVYAPTAGPTSDAVEAMLSALGGRANLESIESAAGRLLIGMRDTRKVDTEALAALGVRGVARSGDRTIQLLLPGRAESWAASLSGGGSGGGAPAAPA